MKTLKAGCFLINKENKSLAVVYRDRRKDYSFPKGHLEKGETIEECAIRETAEETKRVAKIVKDYEPYVVKYDTPTGENCICYMYYALDVGKSDNKSLETHPTYWIPYEEVEEKLSYSNLKNMWNQVKYNVNEIMNQ